MRKSRNLLAAGLLSAMFLMNGGTAWAASAITSVPSYPDTVYFGGKIYTMQEAQVEEGTNRLIPVGKDTKPIMAEVVAAKDGKIIFVGTKADAEAAGYFDTDKVEKIVNLNGKAMYPGFIDGHGHFPDAGTESLYEVDLNSSLVLGEGNGSDSIEAIIAKLKARAETLPEGTLIVGFGYDDTKVAEMRHPNRLDLDKASTKHPIIIGHISGHVKAANTLALEGNGVNADTAVEGVEKFGAKHGVAEEYYGTPTGVLFETAAMGTVSEGKFPQVKQDTQAALARAAQIYAAAGCTIADNGAAGGMDIVNTFQKGVANGGLPIRVLWHPMGCYDMDVQPGFTMDVYGYAARAQLGWSQDALAQPANGMFLYANGSTAKAEIGDDVTFYDVPKVDAVKMTLTGEQFGVPEGLDQEKHANRIMFGAWKILFDGSPQAYTAWMKYPGYYKWAENTADHDFLATKDKETGKVTGYGSVGPDGKPYLSSLAAYNVKPDRLKFWINLYHKYGDSTEIHTNGSAGAEAWVAALEEAALNNPSVKDTRHTSIHGQTLERQHVERLAGEYADLEKNKGMYYQLKGYYDMDDAQKAALPELMKAQNHFVSFFDNHVYFYGDRHRDIFFGPGRAMNISPTGWANHYGVPFSFHNDTTITPISPLRSITSAVTRLTADGKFLGAKGETDIDAKVKYYERDPEEVPGQEMKEFFAYDHRITALQALHAVTFNPAWQNKIEDRVGSIEVGKLADFTIMHKDILDQAEEDATQIANMKVATTIVGDEVVYGVLPGAESISTPGVAPDSEQPEGVEVTPTDTPPADLSKEEVTDGTYAPLPDNHEILAAKQFKFGITEGTTGVIKYQIIGDGTYVSNLCLNKLTANEVIPFEYGYQDRENTLPGYWWIVNNKDLSILKKTDKIEEGDSYTVCFTIGDNSEFDIDKTPGVIEDPNVLSKIFGGSSSGCTVGTNPAYELLALLLASLGVMAGRIFRRRENA